MKSNSFFLTGLLLFIPLCGCADGSPNNSVNQHSKILDSGDILTIFTDATSPSASYFSTSPADRVQLADRMLDILKQTHASMSIINFAESRLRTHPRLERDNFKVPLTDKDGSIYNFTYISDTDTHLYIINYKHIAPNKD